MQGVAKPICFGLFTYSQLFPELTQQSKKLETKEKAHTTDFGGNRSLLGAHSRPTVNHLLLCTRQRRQRRQRSRKILQLLLQNLHAVSHHNSWKMQPAERTGKCFLLPQLRAAGPRGPRGIRCCSHHLAPSSSAQLAAPSPSECHCSAVPFVMTLGVA